MPDTSPTFQEYYQRFEEQMRRQGCTTFTRLLNGATIAHVGSSGPCLAIIAGVHGDERSGPLALLEWVSFHNAPLIPPDRQVWLLPLLNDEGWDANRREWHGLDLNRSFLSQETPPELVRPIMDEWRAQLPDMFLDLHEDSDNPGHPYLFRYPGDEHGLAEQLAAHLGAEMVDWTDFDEWEGSDEVYLRRLGCSRCATIETAGDWSLEQRMRWDLKAVQWCVEHLETCQV
jgi:predicted deacylase